MPCCLGLRPCWPLSGANVLTQGWESRGFWIKCFWQVESRIKGEAAFETLLCQVAAADVIASRRWQVLLEWSRFHAADLFEGTFLASSITTIWHCWGPEPAGSPAGQKKRLRYGCCAPKCLTCGHLQQPCSASYSSNLATIELLTHSLLSSWSLRQDPRSLALICLVLSASQKPNEPHPQ